MPHSLIIVLENVRSHHNVGSCFRSADAFGIDEVILSGITPCPPHRDIHKTALGATESVKWSYCEEFSFRLAQLKEQGYRIIAIEQDQRSIPMMDIPLALGSKLVMVFGNEVKGVSEGLLDVMDEIWEIPQVGAKKSLNISVCAGICMHFVKGRAKN